MNEQTVFAFVSGVVIAFIDNGNVAVVVNVPAEAVDGIAAQGVGGGADIGVLYKTVKSRVGLDYSLNHIGTGGDTVPAVAEHQGILLAFVVPRYYKGGAVAAFACPALNHVEGELGSRNSHIGRCGKFDVVGPVCACRTPILPLFNLLAIVDTLNSRGYNERVGT